MNLSFPFAPRHFWVLFSLFPSLSFSLVTCYIMIVVLALRKIDVATDAGSLGTKQVQFENEMLECNAMLETPKQGEWGEVTKQPI